MYGNPVQDLASKEKPTDVSIFFIPDYIEQVFREKKISLSDFDQAMYNLHAAYEENKGKLPTSFVTRIEGGEVEEGEEGLDVIQKIESHLLTHNYDGFLAKGRIRGRNWSWKTLYF